MPEKKKRKFLAKNPVMTDRSVFRGRGIVPWHPPLRFFLNVQNMIKMSLMLKVFLSFFTEHYSVIARNFRTNKLISQTFFFFCRSLWNRTENRTCSSFSFKTPGYASGDRPELISLKSLEIVLRKH